MTPSTPGCDDSLNTTLRGNTITTRALAWALPLLGAALIAACGGGDEAGQETAAAPGAKAAPVTQQTGTQAGDAVTGGASDLVQPRELHTATPLQDGRVLISGGVARGDLLASAEIYDPATGTWTATEDMNEPRAEHGAVLLNDGKVLVAGGGTSRAPIASAELFDPSTGTWSPTDSMSQARVVYTMVLLNDGRVLAAGGRSSDRVDVSTAEVYDPSTGAWSPVASMTVARWAHTATVLGDGRVLVAGGGAKFEIHPSAEIYDPATDTWSPIADMEGPRIEHKATLLGNGKVLVVAGFGASSLLPTAEVYDVTTDTWTLSQMPQDLHKHALVALADGRALVLGGFTQSSPSRVVVEMAIYDQPTDTWIEAGDMAGERRNLTATLLEDGSVLIVSGMGNIGLLSEVSEVYVPSE